MPFIGRNNPVGSSQTPDFVSDNQAISLLSNIYTAIANEEIFEFGFEAGASFDSDASVSVALYDMTFADSSTDPDNAILVVEVAWLPVEITAGAANTKAITPVSLIEGNDYAVAFKVDLSPSGAAYWMRELLGAGPTTYRAVELGSDPYQFLYDWNNTTIGNWEYVVWGETQPSASSPSITDINTNEEITNAQTGNTIDYADFTNQSGTFTLALRSTVDSNASTDCTNVSLAAGSGTFDAPDYKTFGETPTLSHPLATTASNDVEAFLTETDVEPDESASLLITLLVEAGYEAVEVVSASTAEGSILEGVTLPIVDESIMIGGTDNNSALASNGIVTTDQTTGTRDYWLWKKDAGTTEKIIFNLGGSVDPATLGPESKLSIQLGISL